MFIAQPCICLNALECVHVVCVSVCVPSWLSSGVHGSCGRTGGDGGVPLSPCPPLDALISLAQAVPGGMLGAQRTVPKRRGAEPVLTEHGDLLGNSTRTQRGYALRERKSLVLCL